MEEKKQNERKITIQVEPNIETGVYSNTATVMHSEAEVLLDFGIFVPGRNVIRVVSRVIMSPKHAKMFLRALQENISKYEEKFGEINIKPDQSGPHMTPSIIN